MIVAFTAGSETDFFARIIALKMAEHWKEQVVVDNRPGAGGVLATKLVAAASPDGYTIYMNSMAHAITPAIYTNLPYDTLRDLTGISQVSGVPNVLIVPPAQGVKSVRELIALAKQKPGQLTFGSAGIGSGMHINGEQFRLAADINVVHVAYKGGPEAITDALAGRINFVFSPIGLALPLVKDKRLLALAVSPATRSSALPDVPTVAEAGLPGFEFDTWYGLFAPARTPRGSRTHTATARRERALRRARCSRASVDARRVQPIRARRIRQARRGRQGREPESRVAGALLHFAVHELHDAVDRVARRLRRWIVGDERLTHAFEEM